MSVTEEVKELLCGQVNSSAIDAASSCLKFVADNILADPDVELPEKKVTQFLSGCGKISSHVKRHGPGGRRVYQGRSEHLGEACQVGRCVEK